MENASDALIMIGSMFILIIALSINISSITTLKTKVDSIVELNTRANIAKDEKGNYINYIKDADDARKVGVETIISTIRKSSIENYDVYIIGNNTAGEARIISSNKNSKMKNLIVENIKEFDNKPAIRITQSGNSYNLNVDETTIKDLYDIMKTKTYKEYIGIYQNDTEVAEVNKQTYRIITFCET